MDIKITERVTPKDQYQSEVRFKYVSGKGSVSGIEKLAQIVLVNLLTDQGTSAVRMDRGGNFVSSIRRIGTNPAKASELAAAVQAGVRKVESDMLLDQAQYSLPSTERLSSIEMDSVVPEGQNVAIGVTVISEAGEQASIVI